MSYCYEHGIPHSRFLEWEPEDRAKTIAYAMEKALVCSMCGTAEWEWQEDRRAYAPVVQVCPGCQLKDAMRDDESARGDGAQVTLLPKEIAMPLLERQHVSQVRRRRREREEAQP